MVPTTIKELLHNRLLRLDVEFGNAQGFFSAAKSGLDTDNVAQGDISSHYDAHIPCAMASINDSTIINKSELIRTTKFTTETDSRFFDLVSRFVVLSNDRCARIAGQNIQHNCKNIYHQHSTNDVVVPVGSEDHLHFQDNNSTEHINFENVFYVRDEAVDKHGMKRWIVHHRMIVNQNAADLIVRCCHPVLEGPLPFQKAIPAALKKQLFRIRERNFPDFPLMAVGEILVKKNHV